MSIWGKLKSKKKNHGLQPEEINLLADIIMIFYCAKRRWPTVDELVAVWEELQL